MPGRGNGEDSPPRSITYCIVPGELAAKLHEPLRRHFRPDRRIEVVVEGRRRDRRSGVERRLELQTRDPAARRRIRAETGRRVADRRALQVPVSELELPRRARPYAERLLFVERLIPTTQQLEDRDTARLIARIQAGERDLFSELYMRYFDRVYAYLRIALRDAHEAEDAAQLVFIRVFENISRYERRSAQPFRAWLFRIVRNISLDSRRPGDVVLQEPAVLERVRRRAETAESETQALDWITDRDLLLFVERLPLVQQQVLVLRFMIGMSVEETATVLARTATDVRTLQYRALEFLRTRLRAIGREPRGGGLVSWRRPYRQAQILRNRRFALLGH